MLTWPLLIIPDASYINLNFLRLGRYAVESYLEQILSHGFFHADPVSFCCFIQFLVLTHFYDVNRSGISYVVWRLKKKNPSSGFYSHGPHLIPSRGLLGTNFHAILGVNDVSMDTNSFGSIGITDVQKKKKKKNSRSKRDGAEKQYRVIASMGIMARR